MSLKTYARRFATLRGRPLHGSEWGRFGRMLKLYGSYPMQLALSLYEQGKLGNGRITTLNEFQNYLIKIKNGDEYVSSEDQREVVEETSHIREKGKSIVKDILNDG